MVLVNCILILSEFGGWQMGTHFSEAAVDTKVGLSVSAETNT